MGRKEDEAEKRRAAQKAQLDPESGTRKKGPSDAIQLLVADFRRRAVGMSGAALDAEVDAFLDRVMERHIAVAPEAMQPELREAFKKRLESDPTMQRMLVELRAAAARER
jgi:hypothetical protein